MKHWSLLVRSREMRSLLAASRKLLMLDYDGTLAPFTVERRDALPYQGVRDLLTRLAGRSDWRVVIVSGRSAEEVSSLLGLDCCLEIFGCHGGERLRRDGELERMDIPPAAEKALSSAQCWVEARGLAARLESKHGCRALHVRGLPSARAHEVMAEAGQAFHRIARGAGVVVRTFDGGLEMRCVLFDKGRVVERLLAEEGIPAALGVTAAYLGDDLTDEDAFRALDAAGLTLLVSERNRPSLARYRLRPPEDLLEFLQKCVETEPASQRTGDEGDAVSGDSESGKMSGRLVVVSNRLPITAVRQDDSWTIKAEAGGLVTSLAPVLRDRGGLWVGASGQEGPGDAAAPLAQFSREAGYDLLPIEIPAAKYHDYYEGFSNEIIWPLFHDFQSRCNFEPDYWTAYLDVNKLFARAVADNSCAGDYVWVHDYHLMHVAHFLKELKTERRCGFFLHIPFPEPDIFLKLPWRRQVMLALLEHDLVGFQILADRRNFIRCLNVLLPDIEVWGRGSVVTAEVKGRNVRIGNFPISIDYAAFAKLAAKRDTADKAAAIRQAFLDRTLVLGVDRLDYSKGIPQRLKAVRNALIRFPDLRGRLNVVQILVPSREGVSEYQELKNEIERLVTQINGEFTVPGWVPIHHLYRQFSREELAAYYRAADIAMVTSLRDGMNLVAKEYCASNTAESGVLILSEFAGVAAQFQRLGALLVNPYDIEEVAEVLNAACKMPLPERKMRMHRLRENVRRNNISLWVDSFLDAAFARNLQDFTPQESVRFHERTPFTPKEGPAGPLAPQGAGGALWKQR